MDHFRYRNGRLWAEEVEIGQIVEAVGTPVYVYAGATFTGHLSRIQDAYKQLDVTICFSVKACSNVHILRLLAAAGFSEYRPVAANDTETGKARNRRVDIIVLDPSATAMEPN